jgi:hypothetical protein
MRGWTIALALAACAASAPVRAQSNEVPAEIASSADVAPTAVARLFSPSRFAGGGEEALPPTPSRFARGGGEEVAGTRRLAGLAFGGGVIGALIGGAAAAIVNLVIGCRNGEGWLSGFTCEAGWGFALATGALLGAPIGEVISVARAGDGGSGWLAAGGAAIGLGVGGALVAVLTATTSEATLAVAVGGLLGEIVSTILVPVLWAASRARREPAPAALGFAF